MLKRSFPALILVVSSCYCWADSVVSNRHKQNESYNPCDSFSYDIIEEASPGDDLLVHLESIRHSISKKTDQSGDGFSGSGSGSGSGSDSNTDSVFDIDLVTIRSTEKKDRFKSYLIKKIIKSEHPNAIPLFTSDDEDISSDSGSGTDEVYNSSGAEPPRRSKLKTAMLFLKPSDTPYVMSGSIDISDFSLTICSTLKKSQGGLLGVKDDKPATIKLDFASSSAGSDGSDVSPGKAWFSVTGKGELSIAGVFLNAFESKGNFPIIYADGKSQVNIDRSDILRTTSKPENIVHSNRSLIVVRRGTQAPGIRITHSRLYSNLHKGSIIQSTPIPFGVPWIKKDNILIDVFNSYFYVPEDYCYFDTGSHISLRIKDIHYGSLATPDRYKHFVQVNSDNPLKLFHNHDVFSDDAGMTDYVAATSSELSGQASSIQSNSVAPTVKAGLLSLFLSFARLGAGQF